MNIDDNNIATSIQANFEELAGGDENLDAAELKAAAEGNVASSSSALAARALQTNPELALALALDSADGLDDGVITAKGVQGYLDGDDLSDINISDTTRAPGEIDTNGDGGMSIDEIEAASRGEGDFSPATVRIAQSMMDTPTMRASKEMDTDGSGTVSNEELEAASQGQGNFSQETVDVAQSTLQERIRVEKEIDTDGSGSISNEELEAVSQGQGDFSQEAVDFAEPMLRAESNVNAETSTESQAPIADTETNVAESAFDYNSIQGVSENTSAEFIQEVEAIAERLGTRPEHLLAVMSFETGGSFSPFERNPQSSATGLIQFIEGTANGLGTSTAALANMSQLEQLQFVERYFQSFDSEDLSTLEGVYTAVLAGSPQSDPNAVLFSGGQAYQANRGLDLNNDGQITAEEATTRVAQNINSDQQFA